MRDPGVGVYGTAAVALDLLVKVVAVGSLPRADVVPVLIGVYALSRTAPLHNGGPVARRPQWRSEWEAKLSRMARIAGHLGRCNAAITLG